MKFTLIYEDGYWFVRSFGHHLARNSDKDSQRQWALQPNFPYGNIDICRFDSMEDAKEACCEWMREQQYFAKINARVTFDASTASECLAERYLRMRESLKNMDHLIRSARFQTARTGASEDEDAS